MRDVVEQDGARQRHRAHTARRGRPPRAGPERATARGPQRRARQGDVADERLGVRRALPLDPRPSRGGPHRAECTGVARAPARRRSRHRTRSAASARRRAPGAGAPGRAHPTMRQPPQPPVRPSRTERAERSRAMANAVVTSSAPRPEREPEQERVRTDGRRARRSWSRNAAATSASRAGRRCRSRRSPRRRARRPPAPPPPSRARRAELAPRAAHEDHRAGAPNRDESDGRDRVAPRRIQPIAAHGSSGSFPEASEMEAVLRDLVSLHAHWA